MLILFISIYIITQLQYMNAFLDQRAALEISRGLGIDIYPLVVENALITNICRIIGWLSLFGVFYYGTWLHVLVLIIISTLAGTFYPVRYSRSLKIINKLETIDPNVAFMAKKLIK